MRIESVNEAQNHMVSRFLTDRYRVASHEIRGLYDMTSWSTKLGTIFLAANLHAYVCIFVCILGWFIIAYQQANRVIHVSWGTTIAGFAFKTWRECATQPGLLQYIFRSLLTVVDTCAHRNMILCWVDSCFSDIHVSCVDLLSQYSLTKVADTSMGMRQIYFSVWTKGFWLVMKWMMWPVAAHIANLTRMNGTHYACACVGTVGHTNAVVDTVGHTNAVVDTVGCTNAVDAAYAAIAVTTAQITPKDWMGTEFLTIEPCKCRDEVQRTCSLSQNENQIDAISYVSALAAWGGLQKSQNAAPLAPGNPITDHEVGRRRWCTWKLRPQASAHFIPRTQNMNRPK